MFGVTFQCVCWKMTWLTGPMVLLLVTFCVASAPEKVQVIYPSKTLHPARGSSVKLSCEVNYDFKECDLLYAGWGLGTAKLTNPSKYFTTVNETDSGGNMRRRQVVTEILDLTPNDNGRYQCVAVCNSLDDARGHYIWITVKG